MFQEFKQNKELSRQYLDNLIMRLTMSTLELEGEDGNLASAKQTMRIWNQKKAMYYVLNNPNLIYNKFDFLKDLCEIDNGEVIDFRTTQAQVMGSNVPRTPANQITSELIYLIDNHNYHQSQYFVNNNIDEFFYDEAMFHIKLLHIHPFEDGNGRTARVLLFKHLFHNNIAPAVITKEVKKKYCELIENNDIEGLAKLFKALSNLEHKNMEFIYQAYMEEKKEENIPLKR